ncbi:hypothetical protein AB0F43_31915 [Kribbella sp. NPDC023972]|uniref:hypothetical protein n=1 Tax=Kribbella sp. NPDC023972 TaxID=3154795 RepID=UPI0033C0CDB4
MTTPQGGQPTSQQLLNHLHSAEGWSWVRIGEALKRDPAGLRRIANGKVPGANLQPSLSELVNTGRVSTPPPRRTTKTGDPVRVRGKAGAPSVVPADAPIGARAKAPAKGAKLPRTDVKKAPRGLAVVHNTPQAPRSILAPPERAKPGASKFDESTYTHATGELYKMTIPKTEGPGRERGRQSLMNKLQQAVTKKKRVNFTVTLEDHRVISVGSKRGYDAQDVFNRAQGEGDDPLAWMDDEIAGIEHYGDTEEVEIVGVQMVTFE